MALLIDLFGYLSVIVHGLVILTQSVALGSVFFLVFLARPFAAELGPEGPPLAARIAAVAAWAALGLLASEGAYIAMQVAVIGATTGLPPAGILGADFAVAGLVKCAAALAIAALLLARRAAAPSAALLALALIALAAATLTTHAAARIDGRAPLLLVEGLHQFGAALWIGGIPVFATALRRLAGGAGSARVGTRFSRMSMLGVASILLSGAAMSLAYIGSPGAVYGTAYGVMVAAKVALFGLLLCLGLGNFLVVERLRARPGGSVLRLRRFAEAEIGIGFTLFFAAASLTSVPPAIDLSGPDRVSLGEIAERYAPRWPRLTSPDHDALAISALQSRIDREAAETTRPPSSAFVPGSGELPPRNAADIAWSEYNHHWAGLFVLAVGILALLAQAGFRFARHWPLLFMGLGLFLFIRADPEVWPLGRLGLIESLRDVETLQHRAFVVLIVAFAVFEWRVRVGDIRSGWQPLVFPLVSALGGALLLTHQHAISDVKDQLLIELSHTPLALAGVVAGWSRWLELRLDPARDDTLRRAAGWVWPACLVAVGIILLLYREA